MTEKLQIASLTVEIAARLLTAAGGRPITPEMIRKDIEAGAPVNPDGTIHLVHYAAWLVGRLRTPDSARGDGGQGEVGRGA